MRIFLTIIFDIIIICGSYILSYILKFKISFDPVYILKYGNFISHAQIEPYLQSLYFVVVIWLFSLITNRTYWNRVGLLSGIEEFINICKAGIISTFVIMASTMIIRFYPG